MAVAGAAWYAVTVLRNPAENLIKARDLLASVSKETDAQVQHATTESAQTLLLDYIDAGGEQASTANLLLGIALCVQGAPDAVAYYFQQVDPTQCETLDLSTASVVLFGRGRGHLADQFLEVALARDCSPATREEILLRNRHWRSRIRSFRAIPTMPPPNCCEGRFCSRMQNSSWRPTHFPGLRKSNH